MTLEEIARLARLPDSAVIPADREVAIVGHHDPIYPTPLRLAEGTAALLALIAAEYQAITAGRSGPATIDRTHAALSNSSMWVLEVDGQPATVALRDPVAPGQGVYRCADGRWLYLLVGFPHIVDKTMAAFGCRADEIEDFVARSQSSDLEACLVDAELTGVVIRDHEEWLQHPQGRLLDGEPVVTIERVGDGPRRPLDSLEAVRILDATRVLAGPSAAKTLGVLGANVLHVGSPNVPDLQAAQVDTGAGKRRAFVDLDVAGGVETMRALARNADVFSQSYRATSLANRGLDVERLVAENPSLIYVTENAYGDFGPWRTKRGFDGNVQAATGIHSLHNPPGSPIDRGGIAMALNDYCTGYWAAWGVLHALRRRATEGGAWHVRVALAQTAHWFLRLETPHDMTSGRQNDELMAAVRERSETVASPYGELRRLRFPVEFEHLDTAWGSLERPGASAPSW